jgi:hypothetical protein
MKTVEIIIQGAGLGLFAGVFILTFFYLIKMIWNKITQRRS